MDFNQFYAASHLAGSGQLYNWDALRLEEAKQGELAVHTARLPVVAYGTKLISWLPYRTAQILWFAASVVSLILMVLLWPDANRPLLFLALIWSFPTVLLLVIGQDTPFWLLFCAAGFALLQRGKPVAAGLMLALCLCKFHLTGGIAVVLIAQRRWRAIGASAIACIFLLSACFVIEGPHWVERYLAVFRGPSLSPGIERMPNFRGLAQSLPWPLLAQAVMSILLISLLFAAAKKTQNMGLCAAMAAASGLLLAPHDYGSDCALVAPLIAFAIAQENVSDLLRVWALILMTPVVILLLASNQPVWGQRLTAGFVVAALSVTRFSACSSSRSLRS